MLTNQQGILLVEGGKGFAPGQLSRLAAKAQRVGDVDAVLQHLRSARS